MRQFENKNLIVLHRYPTKKACEQIIIYNNKGEKTFVVNMRNGVLATIETVL